MHDLSQFDAAELVKKLADPNLIVRTLATNELVDRVGTEAITLLEKTAEERIRLGTYQDGHTQADRDYKAALRASGPHAAIMSMSKANRTALHTIWPLERLGAGGELLLARCIASERPALQFAARVQADRAVPGTFMEPKPTTIERQFLDHIWRSDHEGDWRAASEFLARGSTRDGILMSLEFLHYLRFENAWYDKEDKGTDYALRVALRDQLAQPGGYSIAEKEWDLWGCEILAGVSLAVKTPAAAGYLAKHLERTRFASPQAGDYLRHAVLYLPPEKLEAIAGLIESVKDAPLPQRLGVADNLTQAYRQRGLPLSDALTDWTQRTMLDALASSDDARLKRGVEAVRDVKLDAKLDLLAKIVRDDKRDGALRLAALEATANLPASRDLLTTTLGDPRHMIIRKRAAELLAQGGNTDAVLAALPNAPQELALSICGALAKTDAGCTALLDAIEAGKASPRLLLNKAVAGPLITRPKPLRDRAVTLTKDLPPEDARLDAVIAERAAAYGKAKPDATHGAQVFQQSCAVCHRFRNAGGNVGPALDGTAARGPARLIEDILDPNRNVDPAFRQAIIETKDGRTFVGVNLRASDTALTFTEATGKDTTLARADIKSQTISNLSIMPPVFETVFAEKDLADLLAYLLEP